ncbi:MAG: GNAT family N-acetyltransferase [Halobacteriales archaeon]
MEVRRAREAELPAVMTILDAALLQTAAADVRDAVAAGAVLVAASEGRVLGVLVLDPAGAADGARVDAVAVRPGRRGRGLGSALVRAAAERHGRLVADFDAAVRPFWASLGFAVEPADEPGRFRGVLDEPLPRG